jgi:hypothetical protein
VQPAARVLRETCRRTEATTLRPRSPLDSTRRWSAQHSRPRPATTGQRRVTARAPQSTWFKCRVEAMSRHGLVARTTPSASNFEYEYRRALVTVTGVVLAGHSRTPRRAARSRLSARTWYRVLHGLRRERHDDIHARFDVERGANRLYRPQEQVHQWEEELAGQMRPDGRAPTALALRPWPCPLSRDTQRSGSGANPRQPPLARFFASPHELT